MKNDSKIDLEKIEDRLKFLENRQKESHEYFKHTLTAITIIFLFVGIVITILSIISKQEISDAISNMERKFEILSKQALKKPKLVMYYRGQPVSEKTITIRDFDKLTIPLNEIYIKNEGNKSADNISFNIHVSEKISYYEQYMDNVVTSGDWIVTNSFIKGYQTHLIFGAKISLNPDETWNTPWALRFLISEAESMLAKIIIHHSAEKPKEFNLILKIPSQNQQ